MHLRKFIWSETHTADLNENINENFVFSSGLEFVTSIHQIFFEKSEKSLTDKTLQQLLPVLLFRHLPLLLRNQAAFSYSQNTWITHGAVLFLSSEWPIIDLQLPWKQWDTCKLVFSWNLYVKSIKLISRKYFYILSILIKMYSPEATIECCYFKLMFCNIVKISGEGA